MKIVIVIQIVILVEKMEKVIMMIAMRMRTKRRKEEIP
jgi:hypothetical protein